MTPAGQMTITKFDIIHFQVNIVFQCFKFKKYSLSDFVATLSNGVYPDKVV
jgi:hypothetical protein